jgi:hypothetical protein
MARTMADVRRQNREQGHRWFEKETIDFFKTQVGTRLVADRWFWTSDEGPGTGRKFTVREAMPDGRVVTSGQFMAYDTREEAEAAIDALVALEVECSPEHAIPADQLRCACGRAVRSNGG